MMYYPDYYGYGLLTGMMTWTLMICFALLALVLIAGWKIFEKAGQPGWASIVPFYNGYVLYKITWGNGYLFFLQVALAAVVSVPFLGVLAALANLVLTCVTMWKLAEAFGQGIGFTIGLVLIPYIFEMILAFGNYHYLGIPLDGVDANKAVEKMRAHQENITYAQPTDSEKPHVTYENPQTKPQEPSAKEPAETPAESPKADAEEKTETPAASQPDTASEKTEEAAEQEPNS